MREDARHQCPCDCEDEPPPYPAAHAQKLLNMDMNARLCDFASPCVLVSSSPHQLLTMSSSESEVKDKKRKRVDDDPALLAPIATPLADKKLTKKLLSLVKQSMSCSHLFSSVLYYYYHYNIFMRLTIHYSLHLTYHRDQTFHQQYLPL